MMRVIARKALRCWGRSGMLHGRFYMAMEKWGPALAAKSPLATCLPNGSVVECDLRDHIQRQIYFQGVYEPIEAFLFSRILRPGAVVVDAGANIGQYTLLAASVVGSSGSVHSFEPASKNFEILKRHVDANRFGNVRINCNALWHEPAELKFGLPSAPEEAGANAGQYAVDITRKGDDSLSSVKSVRLDDYAKHQGIRRVDVIKMDIEGAEWSALRGMSRILGDDRPILLMEINKLACDRLGYTTGVFWEFLCREFGYTGWRIGGSAQAWQKLAADDDLLQANVMFTPGALPERISKGWDFQECLRWAGGGNRLRVNQ